MANHDDPGYDKRGSAANRRARRAWLLSPVSGFGGDGKTVPCFHCGEPLGALAFEVDRFPVCGHMGGSYRRDNVVPSCRFCNTNRCDTCKGGAAVNGGHQRPGGMPPELEYEEVYA